jgi:hypothetical protein
MRGMEGTTLDVTGTDTTPDALLTGPDDSEAVENLRIADVPLADLEGLTLFEQFLLVWGTPERARILWQQWYESQGETGKGVLDILLAQTIEEHGLTEEEARRRLAVEKYLNDRGISVAAKFMDCYKARKFGAARTLQPMAVRPKKKR